MTLNMSFSLTKKIIIINEPAPANILDNIAFDIKINTTNKVIFILKQSGLFKSVAQGNSTAVFRSFLFSY